MRGKKGREKKDKITELKASWLATTEQRLTCYAEAELSANTFSACTSQEQFQSEEYKANILEVNWGVVFWKKGHFIKIWWDLKKKKKKESVAKTRQKKSTVALERSMHTELLQLLTIQWAQKQRYCTARV